MDKKEISRRTFITTSGKNAIAAIVVGPILVSQCLAKNTSGQMTPVSIDLSDPGNLSLTTIGGSMKIINPLDKKRPIIITRVSETACTALSSRCTHLGCELSLPENSIITCKCHKSQFDLTGKVLHKPAKKNLKSFSATLDGSILTITDLPA
ncbi:MAG: Rieske 2Fe-2S domain-containing protein [Chitinispirillaceae bacterium]|nr:Rieske 2Fe-2S domain-containing protein [Chitinispirillaceae bacterium]